MVTGVFCCAHLLLLYRVSCCPKGKVGPGPSSTGAPQADQLLWLQCTPVRGIHDVKQVCWAPIEHMQVIEIHTAHSSWKFDIDQQPAPCQRNELPLT